MKLLLFFALCSLLKYADAQCYSGASPILCSDASCGGSCTSDNGCYCNDGIDECVPDSGLCPMEDNSCCAALSKWYWDGTLHCCTETVECSPSCYSDEVCNKESAVCNCNASTYAGNTPQDLAPTVSCDGGVMIASVSQCKLEEIGYDYESFHLIDSSAACTFTYNDTIKNLRERSIQVKAAIGWCGNINSRDSSKIYFTNTLHISPFSGPLITKNPIVFNFTCIYNLTMQTSLNFSLNPILSSVVIPSPGAGLGYFTVTMSAYSDSQFTVPIESDQDIYVGSDIYVGIFSEDLDADSFSLRLEKCYATPSQDLSTPNVQLISGGCAANNGVVTKVIKNGDGSEARFQTSAFLFTNYPEVYLFCEVAICNKSSSCGACTSGRSGKAAASGVGVTLSFQDKSYDPNGSGHHTVSPWTMLAASLLGLFVKIF